MYIRFTYVDPKTNQIVNLSSAYSALEFPKVKGLKHVWTAESEYPTNTPNFYGTSFEADVPGVLEVLTEQEYSARYAAELEAHRWKRVPRTISPRQARLVLLDKGLLDKVEPLIDSLPEYEKNKAKISWGFATAFERTDPFVETLGAGLGFTSDQLDELFVEGARR